MLPGFRFLFAAIALSTSILVFGLGAAALLRAAHEQFSSIPSRRGPPETRFTQQNEAAAATLAMLRVVEPPATEPKAPDDIPAAAPSAEQAAIVSTPAEPEPDKIAALKPEDSSLPEIAKPEAPVSEIQPLGEAASVEADAPAPANETAIAAVGEAASPANETVPAAPEPAIASPAADADVASTKIATLGGPPVAIEPSPKATEKATNKATDAKPDQSGVKKHRRAERTKERRRTAQRARQAAQEPADPFALPTITTRSR
jgi:hypothetical protein